MEQLTDESVYLLLGEAFLKDVPAIANVNTRQAEFEFVQNLSSGSIIVYSSDKHFHIKPWKTTWDLLDKL